MTQQGSVVVDWARKDRPGIGIVPPHSQWRATYRFRVAIVTAWSGDETADADITGITEGGDPYRFPAGSRTVRQAREEAESWLMGATD